MTASEGGAAPGRTRPWDPVEHLETQEDAMAYLEAAFEDGDPQVIAAAVGDVARSQGMSSVAATVRLGRERLEKALSRDADPGFGTVLVALEELGLRLHPLMKGRETLPRGKVGKTHWSIGFARPRTGLFVQCGDGPTSSVQHASDHL